MNLQSSLNNIAVEVNGNIITPFLLITVWPWDGSRLDSGEEI